jgi:hypothetical protein
MATPLRLASVCAPSGDVVAREIEGEIIIVPLTSGIGDAEGELFTFSETGRAIWKRLDGKRTLREVSGELSAEFDGPAGEIERDVIGLMEELRKRGIVVEVSRK